jgi:tubulin beta
MPRAVLFNLEPGAIGAVRASPLGDLFRPENLVIKIASAGNNWAKAYNSKAERELCCITLLRNGFCSKLRAPRRSTSLGSCVCVGLELARCVH